jgi:hypothetical protein
VAKEQLKIPTPFINALLACLKDDLVRKNNHDPK